MKPFVTVLLAAFLALPSPASSPESASSQKKNASRHARNPKIAIVAHRGYWNCESAGFSRNSLAALRQAQCNRFWGSEFDVNMTSDGQLLVFHDSAVDGKRIEDFPASAFDYYRLPNGEGIPTLDEYLSQGKKGRSVLVLELKPHSTKEIENRAVALVLEKLREHRLLRRRRVMFISFSINICQEFARLAPGFTVQYLGADLTPEQVSGLGIGGIDTKYRVLLENGAERVRQAHDLSMSVNVWTVNDTLVMRQAIDAGVDAITTDKPRELRSLLERRERRR